MIKVYASTIDSEPLETYDISGVTLHQWLTDNVDGYELGETQPISATVNGEIVAPLDWPQLTIGDGDWVELRVQPGKSAFKAAFGFISKIFSFLAPKPKTSQQQNSQQGASISGAEIEANEPKLNDAIPELAGRHKRFPDYLNQPRKYFVNPTTQAVDVFMCVTAGKCSIPESGITIGKTPVAALGENFNYQIFGPNEVVSSHPSSRCWYNVPEVGSSTGSAGLRISAGDKGTRYAKASQFKILGNSITIPPSAGSAPQDWEVGGNVLIEDRTRTIEIVDGVGGSRDKIRGDFSGLGLAVNATFSLFGLAGYETAYKVITYTDSVNVLGTASVLKGVKVAPLDYSSPIAFSVGASSIVLDELYESSVALVTAINSQLAGFTCTESGGVLTITEQSPFSGKAVPISGYYDPVFGAAPTMTTGTETRSYSEMTVDIARPRSTGLYFTPATSMPIGTFYNIGISRNTVNLAKFSIITWGVYYKITSYIVVDNLVVGWEFQKLNQDGSPDMSWAGFHKNTTTPHVTMEYDQSKVVGGWLGPFMACPVGEKTDYLEWDFFASGGLGLMDGDGNIVAVNRELELQYREFNSGAEWTSVVRVVSGASRDQLGWSFGLSVPRATIEVRVRRLGAEDKRTNAMDKLEWYGLRSFMPSPSRYAGVTTMAATLIGSDRIAERTENQISVIATRILPVRSGGTWQPEQATSDIVPFVCHIAKSIGYTDAELDLEELDRLDAVWKTRGDKFDFIFNKSSPVRDCINDVLLAGFAEMTVDAGRIRPVRDEPRSQFEHMYTPQNMTGSLKRSFTLRHPDDSDGVDVEYVDPITWVAQVVQCRLAGDLGFKVTKMRAEGVTSRTRAWRIGMRLRREQRYQRWSYSFGTEMDALNSRYMSYCALGDDVPGYGQSAWIKDIVAAGTGQAALLVSEPLDWSAGGAHVLAWRKEDGTLAGPYPAIMGDDEFEVLVTMPKPWPNPYLQQEPPQILFGTPERWTFPALIKKINPKGMDSVSVSAVNYAPEMYFDDDNTPPN